MPQVVHLGGGGSSQPPRPGAPRGTGSSGLDDQKKLLLTIGLAVAILAGVGFTVFNAIPHAPPADAVSASDREKQEEAKMTPEQRDAALRAQQGANKPVAQPDGAAR